MILAATIVVLCAWGFYASARMARKAARAARGELSEPSVVQTPRARVLGGAPNAVFGLAYYALLLLALPFAHVALVWGVALAATVLAASFSVYLAYSLLFVTKMPCPYCWSSHAVNWVLPVLWYLAR